MLANKIIKSTHGNPFLKAIFYRNDGKAIIPEIMVVESFLETTDLPSFAHALLHNCELNTEAVQSNSSRSVAYIFFMSDDYDDK